MNKLCLIVGLAFLTSCLPKNNAEKDMETLSEWMTGVFSSQEQAARDSAFYSINLAMFPIWEDNKEARWLYVEQAVSSNLEKPYRQRVYRLTNRSEGVYESAVFELPDPGKFINSWKNLGLFNSISPKDLTVREGCSVFLKKNGKESFTGSTPEKQCLSTMRGASYATSEVSVYVDKIISWDQGWNAADEQVWGAVKGGYVFKRLEKTPVVKP